MSYKVSIKLRNFFAIRYRWYWSVEWEFMPGEWGGIGGWQRTKKNAKRVADEAVTAHESA